MTCPECKSKFSGAACYCGWSQTKLEKDRSSLYCSWNQNGKKCLDRATISPGTRPDIGPWFCSWHFECLAMPQMAEDRAEFAKWLSYRKHPETDEQEVVT